MSTPTNVYMNWTGIVVTPNGGTAIPIPEVVDVEVLEQEVLEAWQADGHKFATVLVSAAGARGMTIHGGAINKLDSIPPGTPCTVVGVLNDARNTSGSGAMTHTLSNAVLADRPRSGRSNKFAGGSVTFVAFSSDGTVDPLAITTAA